MRTFRVHYELLDCGVYEQDIMTFSSGSALSLVHRVFPDAINVYVVREL